MNEELLSQLERLSRLRENGTLTQSEFERQKAALIGSPAEKTPPPPSAPHSPLQVKRNPPVETNKNVLVKVGLVVLGLIAIISIFNGGKDNQNSDTSSDSIDTSSTNLLSTDTIATPPVAPAKVDKWLYLDDTDKMGSKYFIASIDANEPLQFDFPYDGGSTATFTIRKKGGGTDVYLRVSKGQFIINSYDGGEARIRFDDGKPVTYSTSGSSDSSSDIIFFDSESKLVSRIKKAKKMVIEAQFYSEGNRQMEFDVENLKWKH